jgi:DNA-binding NarL/FixJ family response regulator
MTSTSQGPPYDVVVIDDLDVVRSGVVSLQLTRPDAVRSVRTYASVDEIDLSQQPPDVVVLDYWLGRNDVASLPAIPLLKGWCAAVLLYTAEQGPAPLRAAMAQGIDGLCLKSDGMPALADAIASVGAGQLVFSGPLARAALDDETLGAHLTDREIEVLRGLAAGFTPAEVAARLYLAPSTVKTHVEHIRSKYVRVTGGPVNATRMLYEGVRDGYVRPPSRGAENPEIA